MIIFYHENCIDNFIIDTHVFSLTGLVKENVMLFMYIHYIHIVRSLYMAFCTALSIVKCMCVCV